MPSQPTNAGRDQVEVHNRLDVVVLSILDAEGHEVATTMIPNEARAVAEQLNASAASAEQTPGR